MKLETVSYKDNEVSMFLLQENFLRTYLSHLLNVQKFYQKIPHRKIDT